MFEISFSYVKDTSMQCICVLWANLTLVSVIVFINKIKNTQTIQHNVQTAKAELQDSNNNILSHLKQILTTKLAIKMRHCSQECVSSGY